MHSFFDVTGGTSGVMAHAAGGFWQVENMVSSKTG